jgi:hypothetical protein
LRHLFQVWSDKPDWFVDGRELLTAALEASDARLVDLVCEETGNVLAQQIYLTLLLLAVQRGRVDALELARPNWRHVFGFVGRYAFGRKAAAVRRWLQAAYEHETRRL